MVLSCKNNSAFLADRFGPKMPQPFCVRSCCCVKKEDAATYELSTVVITHITDCNFCCQVGVHIADVSHFIRPGTAIDREALNRATTVYLIDKVRSSLASGL